MVGDNTIDRRPALLPDHSDGQPDFFVCDIFDATPKSDMASMEHPIFSLSTKPDMQARRYENGDSYAEIRPSYHGLATVHDRDVLIYCISQVMAKLNRGEKVSRNLRFKAYDLLTSTNRKTDGRGYEQLKSAFERLQGTQIATNVVTGGREQFNVFSLIDRASIVRETRDGRMQEVEITLSDWVFNAIRANEVLTLNRDYFRLRKPLERRLYELARKHCNRSSKWRIGLDKLKNKMGSSSTSKEFARLLRNIIADDEAEGHFPDYRFELDGDNLNVYPKSGFAEAIDGTSQARLAMIHPDTYEKAREAAPGWDVYELESRWRDWVARGQKSPHNPDKAFVGFCRSWFKRNGCP